MYINCFHSITQGREMREMYIRRCAPGRFALALSIIINRKVEKKREGRHVKRKNLAQRDIFLDFSARYDFSCGHTSFSRLLLTVVLSRTFLPSFYRRPAKSRTLMREYRAYDLCSRRC